MELDLSALPMQMAVDTALRASPFDRDQVIINADSLSPEEFERARAEQLEMLARLKAELGG